VPLESSDFTSCRRIYQLRAPLPASWQHTPHTDPAMWYRRVQDGREHCTVAV
jgi:hypothetical protein